MKPPINYPNGHHRRQMTKPTNYADRGMTFEKDINHANDYYRLHDRAIIYKKPTPITIAHVDYPRRSAARITEAYFKLPSTTDYNGIYKGKYIDFEAKECANKTMFPLKSFHEHQMQHLKAVSSHGAIAFVLIRFTAYNETYLLPADKLFPYIDSLKRRSLPYRWIKREGIAVFSDSLNPVDYLSAVDSYYFDIIKRDSGK